MAMDFPISPTLNQTYTFSSKTWKWDGSVWKQQVQDAVGLPIQATNSGKYLTTDGSTASWGTITLGGGPVTFNANTISTNQTITNGSNGFSVGPIIIGNNNTVTVATSQRWVIL